MVSLVGGIGAHAHAGADGGEARRFHPTTAPSPVPSPFCSTSLTLTTVPHSAHSFFAAGGSASAFSACVRGRTPVMAATPTPQATITLAAAPATRGWMRIL